MLVSDFDKKLLAIFNIFGGIWSLIDFVDFSILDSFFEALKLNFGVGLTVLTSKYLLFLGS